MKYKPEDYIECGFYSDDTEIKNHTEKVVRCRKPHKCANCQKQIEIGDYALAESGFMDGKPVRCYTCLPCIDEWLDEINEQTTTKVEYPTKSAGQCSRAGAGLSDI